MRAFGSASAVLRCPAAGRPARTPRGPLMRQLGSAARVQPVRSLASGPSPPRKPPAKAGSQRKRSAKSQSSPSAAPQKAVAGAKELDNTDKSEILAAIKELKSDVKELKSDVKELKSDVEELKSDFTRRLDSHEKYLKYVSSNVDRSALFPEYLATYLSYTTPVLFSNTQQVVKYLQTCQGFGVSEHTMLVRLREWLRGYHADTLRVLALNFPPSKYPELRVPTLEQAIGNPALLDLNAIKTYAGLQVFWALKELFSALKKKGAEYASEPTPAFDFLTLVAVATAKTQPHIQCDMQGSVERNAATGCLTIEVVECKRTLDKTTRSHARQQLTTALETLMCACIAVGETSEIHLIGVVRFNESKVRALPDKEKVGDIAIRYKKIGV